MRSYQVRQITLSCSDLHLRSQDCAIAAHPKPCAEFAKFIKSLPSWLFCMLSLASLFQKKKFGGMGSVSNSLNTDKA